MKLKPLHRLFKWFTFVQLSLAMLVICLISGVLLVVPYDVNSPFESISFFMLTNQAASLFRNMHYWSAQFFLVFTLIHLYDHFTRDKQVKVKFWLWFRLSATVLIVFLAMITGFILKGDQDAGQAGLIFSQLLGLVPLVGEAL
jgi:quinol-cytochrome oxidoreductase complex cytochrome b subunit